MWLRVYAESEGGVLAEIGERRFGTVLEDAQGAYPAEMWEAVAVRSDDRIPPRQSVAESYAFTMPAAAEEATIVAVLNYRSMPDELARAAGVENPVTVMAEVRESVYASEAARDGEPEAPADDAPAQAAAAWWPYAAGVALVALVAGAYVLLRRAKTGGRPADAG